MVPVGKRPKVGLVVLEIKSKAVGAASRNMVVWAKFLSVETPVVENTLRRRCGTR
jgi:hypothetical protein